MGCGKEVEWVSGRGGLCKGVRLEAGVGTSPALGRLSGHAEHSSDATEKTSSLDRYQKEQCWLSHTAVAAAGGPGLESQAESHR